MGMLCIFVGNVLKFFRQGDAVKSRQAFKYLSKHIYSNVYFFKSTQPTLVEDNEGGTNLAVLMGLGSKLPWESTDACFSSIPSRLTSTKSGGRAPAMAHRHDLAILKSSASYFCRRDGRGEEEESYYRVFQHCS